MSDSNNTNELPEILSANTYFWSPGSHASSRRGNETRRTGEVANFFSANGFETRNDGETVRASKDGVEVKFSYSESCKNVYKRVQVTRGGKRSNISAVKKLLGIK